MCVQQGEDSENGEERMGSPVPSRGILAARQYGKRRAEPPRLVKAREEVEVRIGEAASLLRRIPPQAPYGQRMSPSGRNRKKERSPVVGRPHWDHYILAHTYRSLL